MLVSKLVLWAQSTTENYIRAKNRLQLWFSLNTSQSLTTCCASSYQFINPAWCYQCITSFINLASAYQCMTQFTNPSKFHVSQIKTNQYNNNNNNGNFYSVVSHQQAWAHRALQNQSNLQINVYISLHFHFDTSDIIMILELTHQHQNLHGTVEAFSLVYCCAKPERSHFDSKS